MAEVQNEYQMYTPNHCFLGFFLYYFLADSSALPVVFALNKNLLVRTKIIDCKFKVVLFYFIKEKGKMANRKLC